MDTGDKQQRITHHVNLRKRSFSANSASFSRGVKRDAFDCFKDHCDDYVSRHEMQAALCNEFGDGDAIGRTLVAVASCFRSNAILVAVNPDHASV